MVRVTTTISLLAVLLILAFSFLAVVAQQPSNGTNEYRLAAVNGSATTMDTLTSDAGRGVWVAENPDLDGDGLPEIITTEYNDGGRVFVYEVIGDDMLELVWASKVLNDTLFGGGSTPRSVTTGDFDNNGMQEIIIPIGYSAKDEYEAEARGIYIYEHTGADNDYGTEPVHHMGFEDIDPAFEDVNVGRTESGLSCSDIDGDGRSELLFPPRAFDFDVAKLYIMQVTSGTFAGGDAVIENEYVYEEMVQPPNIFPDGYVPCGTEIGDVDNDGFDEIIVAGWTNIASGAGIGFIQINGEDDYTPGSIVHLTDFSAFIVKANPLFAEVNGQPVIYIHGTDAGAGFSQIWVMFNIVSDLFVSDANIAELHSEVGWWSAWAVGDQDHTVSSAGDGIDLYLYGGGGSILDIEHDGSGDVTDMNSYTTTKVYDLSDHYDSFDGLFNDFYTYPGMDLDNDGNRDIAVSYKGSPIDSLNGQSLARNGKHVFLFEFGDSLSSTPITSIDDLTQTIMPDDYQLEQNYPNPFNPTTMIPFVLPISKSISVEIYNTLGQRVKTIVNGTHYAAGRHEVAWDGTDESGARVASGVYVYKLTYGNFAKSRQMVLVR